ncbi:MAG: hypothetical protein WB784_05225 [Rhodanobacteraceae bacterium]
MKRSFFAELKRRNVVRAGAFYAAAAWLLVQIATQVAPYFLISEWVVRIIVVAAIIGFPFALAFAWFYELTPDGLKRESAVVPEQSITRSTGRQLDRLIIAVLAGAVVLLLADKFVLRHDAGARTADKSIAVLPLVNESGDAQQDYFADGLSEELIAALSQVHELKVIGRNSSFQFRGKQQDDTAGIGAKLGVATLLEGSVRRLGGRVHILVQLVRAANGQLLWSQSYDREIMDVFAVQSEIATSVAGALQVTLLGKIAESNDKPPSGNLDAYNALLQGKFYAARRNRADYEKAVGYYKDAIRLDPGYALAYAQIAIAQQWFIDWVANGPGERETTRPLARANAHKAVELDPQLVEAQGALGVTEAWSDLDIPAAHATMKTAVSMDPTNAQNLYQLAEMTASLGRVDDAVILIRKALVLEPLNATYHFSQGWYLLSLDRLEESQAELKRAIDLQPAAVGCHYFLAIVQIKRGQAARALAEAQAEPGPGQRRSALALAWFALGDHAKADAALDDMIRADAQFRPVAIAMVYAYRGEKDQALAWLNRGWQARDPTVTTILYYPFIVPTLKGDARFSTYCRNVGLPIPAGVSAVATHTSAVPKPASGK